MKRITRMYNILGEMINASRENNVERISLLNHVFDILSLKVWSFPPTETDLAYDNCRQSAMFSATVPGQSHYDFLEDAVERYKAIEKPSRNGNICRQF